MKLILAFSICIVVSSGDDIISKEEASSFLHRVRRSNAGNIFEELSPGNLERECVEESCSAEESFEISDNHDIAAKLWERYTECKRGKFTSGRRLDERESKAELRKCLKDSDHCSPNPCVESNAELCKDLLDRFECVCKPGFEGVTCEEATDNCVTASCDLIGTNLCVNSDNSYRCECKAGYAGRHCDEVIDNCLTSNCNKVGTSRCVNSLNTFLCECNEGYAGTLCDEATDKCTSNCDPIGTNLCVNSVNSYRCECKAGYAGRHCDEDLNECQSNPCSSHGVCIDKVNSFLCQCEDLYSGTLCEDAVDDCRVHGCSGRGRCEVVGGAHSCRCDSGFSGKVCDEEVDLCEPSPCQQKCTSSGGRFECSCNRGFLLDLSDSASCRDINECTMTSHGCSDDCVNTEGSFHCVCRDGYKLDALFKRYCGDIDECAENNGGCSGRCLNEDGSYSCVCPDGYYSNNGGVDCLDKDECLESPGCEYTCVNTPGSFHCTCPDGFSLNYDKQSCRDINECASSSPPCDQKCQNSPGNYSCSCNYGYERHQNACVDIDECATDNGRCAELCVNSDGSFRCDCPAGFELVGRRCFDIRECASNPCVKGRCKEGFLSFSCTCYYGYSGDRCQFEGDPCADVDCNNGDCVIEEDKASCSCDDGYTGENCQDDVDECLIANGNCTNRCENSFGSFVCACNPGYEMKENECSDTNECEDKELCEHDCDNTMGSFRCSCRNGYKLNEDGRHCDDIDECISTPCAQRCENNEGSFTCSCMNGYLLNSDGASCDDVDECGTDRESLCQQICTNVIGSFKCACPEGFELLDDRMTCQEAISCLGNLQEPLKGRLQIGAKSVDYVSQRVMTELQKKVYVSAKFRTFHSEGVILALNDVTMTKYAYVAIANGNIQVGYDNGAGHTAVSTLNNTIVSDGEWHMVKFRKSGSNLKVVVDDVTMNRARMSGSRMMFAPGSLIRFGGVPTNHSITNETNSQFRGCLSNIHVKGGKSTWTSSKRKVFKSRKHCFADADEHGYYFTGEGYARVEFRRRLDFKFAAKIRTGRSSGTIVATGNGSLVLMMSGGHVRAEMRDKTGGIVTSSTHESASLCGGLWASVNLAVSRGHLRMRVNGVAAKVIGPGGNLPQHYSVYVGGLPGGSVPSFHGNMKRIFINKKKVDLLHSRDFSGVNVVSMPR